ncbi:glycosyltransferase [Luminiphilus sp.]|nr:glycosyltransferase [Luminiphilus sp.]
MMKADKRPDVILTAMPAPITCLVAAVLAKIWKVPHYIDARDMWPDILLDELKGIKKLAVFPVVLLMRIELKVALKWAQGLIGITLPFRDYLLEVAGRIAGPTDAAFPIGYLEQDIKYDEKSEVAFWLEKGVHFSSREKIIYFAGTLNKTVLTEASKVAQALRIVEKNGLSVKLVFCGKGNAEKALRMHFFGLRNVIFPGHVGATHLRFLKEKSSIALLSVQSRKDYLNSLSNKFFDYSSGGLPIVTNLAGVPKATLERHQAGFCYETSEELADIIALLVLDDELLGQYSRNSRRMFVDHFDAKQVYTRFVRHLERGML